MQRGVDTKGIQIISQKRLFIQSTKGSQPPPLVFGRDSKAGSELGKLQNGKRGWLQEHPDSRLLEEEAADGLPRHGILWDRQGECIWLSVVGPKSETVNY